MDPRRRFLAADADLQDRLLDAVLARHAVEPMPPEWITAIAAAVRFRPETVRDAPHDRLLRILRRAVGRLDRSLVAALCRMGVAAGWPEYAAVLHRALGRGADAAALDAATRAEPAALLGALRAIDDSEDLRRIAFAAEAAGLSAELRALLEAADRAADDGARPDPEDRSEPVDVEDDGSDTGLSDAAEFTTLDHVVLRAIVNTLAGSPGALHPDQLDDFVEELVALNPARVRTRFHAGFLDALLDREPDARERPTDNADRRAWHRAGHLMGTLRLRGAHPFLDALAVAEAAAADRPFPVPAGTPRAAAWAVVADEAIPALLERGEVDRVLDWVEHHLAGTRHRALPAVLDWARRALVGGDAAAVRMVLERARRALQSTPARSEHGDVAELERRLAVAWRMEGRFTEARSVVDRLLETASGAYERSRLLGDRVLIALGFRSLESFALPLRIADRQAFLDALRASHALIDAACDHPRSVVPARVARAAVAVLDRHADDVATAAAIDDLDAALAEMTGAETGFWTATGLPDRARFYLACLELRSLDERRLIEALSRLERSLEDAGAEWPADLAIAAIRDALVLDDVRVGRLVGHAFARWPGELLTDGDFLEASASSRRARDRVVAGLRDRAVELSAAEAWAAWTAVLRGALPVTRRDVEVAREALDALELLATERPHDARMLDLLDDPTHYEPAWDAADARGARFRIRLARGEVDQARAILAEIAHAAITRREDGIEDLVDQCAALGATDDELEALRRRLRAEVGEHAPVSTATLDDAVAAARAVDVLFIGGNETQAAYAERLHTWFAARFPRSTLRLELSGWSANWERESKRLATAVANSDSVVLMRFVRTNLGRAMRAACNDHGVPWVPCTGHGLASLQRAIESAVDIGGRRTDPAPAG